MTRRLVIFLKTNRIQLKSSTIFALVVIAIWSFTPSMAQSTISGELQAYPTGLIPGLKWENQISEKESLGLRLGYNWFRHRDLGVHEDERGGGFGFTIGYKRYWKQMQKGLFIGLRNDIWRNNVDWKDRIGEIDEIQGKSQITVLQPTIEFGISLQTESGLILSPALGLGFEWNVKTRGQPTGEGAIILFGVSIGKIL